MINKIRQSKAIVFFIQTVVPFGIPFIFEIPDTIMVLKAKFVLAIIASCLDLLIIYAIAKDVKIDRQILFRNHAARCAYSHIYELNESKRNYYIDRVNNNSPNNRYNAVRFINEACRSFCNVIGEITHIEKEYMHTSFIYKVKGSEKWVWATQKESTFRESSEKFINKKNTVFNQLINDLRK